MEDYGLALKLLRIHFKYTQREIAEKVGISHHALSKWENGINQPDIHALRVICALYNITAEDFFRIAAGEPLEKILQEKAETNKNKIDKNTRRNFMDCKKCGTPAVDGAVYCHNCGERVDGKKACPVCGDLNEQEYKFCIYCGARLDGKTVCKTCGTEHEGKYCPSCGAKEGKAERSVRAKSGAKKGLYGKIMHIVALSLGLCAALTAFIFTFFICFEEEPSIFYYFKDSFKDLKEVKNMMGGQYYSGAVNALRYTYTIAACVIAAAALASVATLFTFTVIRSVKALCGKATRSPLKMATLTAFCYVLSVVLLYGLEAGAISGEEFELNDGTVAGLIVCGITFVGAVVCTMLSDFQKFKDRGFIVRLICAGACIVIGTVALALVSNAHVKTVVKTGSNYSSAVASFRAPSLQMATMILGLFSQVYAGNAYSHLKFEMNTISAFGILGEALLLAAIAFGVIALFKNIRNCNEKKYGSGMLWTILSFGCLVGVLVFDILLANQARFIIRTTDISSGVVFDLERDFAWVIVALVFAFINMGVAIAAKIVFAKKGKTENE